MGRASNEQQVDLADLLIAAANDEGFPLAGVVDIDRAYQRGLIQPHITRYDQWLGEGCAGEMSYLVRGRDRRADPRLVFPEAKSILCVAIPYPRRPAGTDREAGVRYARYLQGQDYHEDIAERLGRVMEKAKQTALGAQLSWKICVDTSAVLERSWAALAGLGWIGKNTLLIHPTHGSYLFLGEVLLNLETGRAPSPLPNYCGNCTRCLEACPTQALTRPGHLDSRKCISYWTLEKRGPLELTEPQKKGIGNWIAGCDVCQEVCPFNLKPVRREAEAGASVAPPPTTSAASRQLWDDLLSESAEDYRARVIGSALNRVKPAQFSRNLAIALANSASALAPGERARLLEVARQRRDSEQDASAYREWERCVSLLSEADSV